MNSLESYIDACVQKMANNEDFTSEMAEGLRQYPYAAALYFIRGSEAAESSHFNAALDDFATSLVLEPEFHLARLQYIICCFKAERVGMVPVLIQPLVIAGGSFAMIANLFIHLFTGSLENFDRQIDILAEQKDVLPSVLKNLQNLREYLVDPLQTENAELSTSSEVSSILLEIYQQKH